MNKINTKDQSWLLLKREVEDYVNKNKKKYLDFFLFLKFLFVIFICAFSYINILFSENYLSLSINLLGLTFGLLLMAFMCHSLTHVAYFSNKKINVKLGFFWDLFLGVSKDFWRYKHNSLHHVYTNINNKDDDINVGNIFRFSQYQKKHWFHRYQYLYAPFLYLLNYLNMIITYNIKYFQIKKRNFSEIIIFIFFKILFFFFLLFPFYLLEIKFSILYFLNLLLFGFLGAIILGVSHLFEEVQILDEAKEHEFFSSQVITTSNHSANVFFNELFFGLNYQLEHHLFPQLNYYYYPKINHIVKKHIELNNLIYYEHKTIFDAMFSHFKFLKKMGE